MRTSYFYVWVCGDFVVIDLRYWTEHIVCCNTETRSQCKTTLGCKKWSHLQNIGMCLFYVFCMNEAWHWNIECPEADCCDKGNGRSAKTSNFLSSWKKTWTVEFVFIWHGRRDIYFSRRSEACAPAQLTVDFTACVRVLMEVIRILVSKWQEFEKLDSIFYLNILVYFICIS
jgi:hypothetical protein